MRKNSLCLFSRIIFLFSTLILGQNCQTKPREVSMAFYHWKTTVDTSDFKNIKNEKIYVRLFDVDWDEEAKMPKPLAELQDIEQFKNSKKITPVVFITNKTFSQIAENQIDALVLRIFDKIKKNMSASCAIKPCMTEGYIHRDSTSKPLKRWGGNIMGGMGLAASTTAWQLSTPPVLW